MLKYIYKKKQKKNCMIFQIIPKCYIVTLKYKLIVYFCKSIHDMINKYIISQQVEEYNITI